MSEAHVGSQDAVKRQLAADMIRTFGELRLRVTGSSMLPSVFPGDILSVKRSEVTDISSGDMVLFERQGHLCAHYVVRKASDRGQTYLVTRGHLLSCADPPVSPRELLGRVTSIERGRFHIDPQAALSIHSRIIAIVLRRSVLATRLMLHMLASRRSAAK